MHVPAQEYLEHAAPLLGGYHAAACALNVGAVVYCVRRRRFGWAAVWAAVAAGLAWWAAEAFLGSPPEWSLSTKRAIDAALGPVSVTLGSFVGLVALFLGRRFFVKPAVAWAGLNGAMVFLGLSMADPQFASVVTKPDNVPIVAMVFLLGFFTWWATAQAVRNDLRRAQGLPPVEAEQAKEKVLVWPEVVYLELIGAIIATVLLIVWSLLLRAPLEAPANPAVTPNPSKAPWYFLGLQEMLLYFDPWMAGVVLPLLIILGLMAIPYLDVSKRGSGYYTINQRRPVYLTFQFGFLQLWILLILIGVFMRGPNWNFFGLFEARDPNKVVALHNVKLSEYFWVDLLGRPVPQVAPGSGALAELGAILWRESAGLVFLALYFLGLPILLARTVLRRARQEMGRARYTIMIFLLLMMLMLPLKMILHWTANLSYLVSMPEYFLNF